MGEDGRIDYVELPGGDMVATKRFYEQAFGWAFTDYGPDYAAFDEGLDGGFNGHIEDRAKAPLVILYADDLDAMADKVRAAGGEIIRGPYDFPGGRRFHFRDPSGNEMGVWSET
jgi:predicted enzyme related to lactoylglutathione lyase